MGAMATREASRAELIRAQKLPKRIKVLLKAWRAITRHGITRQVLYNQIQKKKKYFYLYDRCQNR